jgi:hypothetical protein
MDYASIYYSSFFSKGVIPRGRNKESNGENINICLNYYISREPKRIYFYFL